MLPQLVLCCVFLLTGAMETQDIPCKIFDKLTRHVTGEGMAKAESDKEKKQWDKPSWNGTPDKKEKALIEKLRGFLGKYVEEYFEANEQITKNKFADPGCVGVQIKQSSAAGEMDGVNWDAQDEKYLVMSVKIQERRAKKGDDWDNLTEIQKQLKLHQDWILVNGKKEKNPCVDALTTTLRNNADLATEDKDTKMAYWKRGFDMKDGGDLALPDKHTQANRNLWLTVTLPQIAHQVVAGESYICGEEELWKPADRMLDEELVAMPPVSTGTIQSILQKTFAFLIVFVFAALTYRFYALKSTIENQYEPLAV